MNSSRDHSPTSYITRRAPLTGGIVAAVLYVVTDVAASLNYPGHSFTDQAVLPQAASVVPLVSLSSLPSLAFAFGLWNVSYQNRPLRMMAMMFAGSALVGLVLWNFFPMRMRGADGSLTDTVHLILATNPFVLLTLVVGVPVFRGWFRWYTAAMIVALLVPAAFAFRYALEVLANLPTPGLGLSERAAQYAYELWHAILTIVLLGSTTGHV